MKNCQPGIRGGPVAASQSETGSLRRAGAGGEDCNVTCTSIHQIFRIKSHFWMQPVQNQIKRVLRCPNPLPFNKYITSEVRKQCVYHYRWRRLKWAALIYHAVWAVVYKLLTEYVQPCFSPFEYLVSFGRTLTLYMSLLHINIDPRRYIIVENNAYCNKLFYFVAL